MLYTHNSPRPDDLFDNPPLQARGAAEPIEAGSVRWISGERILERKRHQDVHLERLQRLLVDDVSRGEYDSAERRCSE